jgi:hypothetical protein
VSQLDKIGFLPRSSFWMSHPADELFDNFNAEEGSYPLTTFASS